MQSDGATWLRLCIPSCPNQAILSHTKVPNIDTFSERLVKTAEMQSEMAKTEGGRTAPQNRIKGKAEPSQQVSGSSRNKKKNMDAEAETKGAIRMGDVCQDAF